MDPGTWATGYAVLEAGTSIQAQDWGVLKFKAGTPLQERLFQIYSRLLEIIDLHGPGQVAVEDPFMGRGSHSFTGPALALGQAQAAVMIAATGRGLPVSRYAPAQVKLAVADYGRASKGQVQELVARQLGLEADALPNDAADALAIALCHLAHQRVEARLTQQTTTGRRG